MSTPETIAIGATAVWLLALTLITLLVVRQLGLLTVRLSIAMPHSAADDAGLQLGATVPSELWEVLGLENPANEERRRFVFLSVTCGTCRQVAAQLTLNDVDDRTAFLIGGAAENAAAVVSLLPRPELAQLEPIASRVSRLLDIDTVPFAVATQGETVTAKAFLTTGADFVKLAPDYGEHNRDTPWLPRILMGRGTKQSQEELV